MKRTIIITAISVITLLFLTFLCRYLDLFWLEQTARSKGVITKASPYHLGKGVYFQKAYYQFQVGTKEYNGVFTATKSHGIQTKGDSILIEYVISNPSRNKVIGFYR